MKKYLLITFVMLIITSCDFIDYGKDYNVYEYRLHLSYLLQKPSGFVIPLKDSVYVQYEFPYSFQSWYTMSEVSQPKMGMTWTNKQGETDIAFRSSGQYVFLESRYRCDNIDYKHYDTIKFENGKQKNLEIVLLQSKDIK